MSEKVLKLVAELERESFYHGWNKALYDHADTHHNVKVRQEMLRREELVGKILGEIKHELGEAKP